MPSKIYPGTITLNGIVETTSVRAYFIGSSIHISDGAKDFRCNKKIMLSPFGATSLTQFTPVAALGKLSYARSVRKWRIAGDRLGEINWGPLGHPADGEFELRPIASFEASARYSSEKIALEFSGSTEKGFEVCYFARTVERLDLEAWSFKIQFEVSRERLREFLEGPSDCLDSFVEQPDAGNAAPERC